MKVRVLFCAVALVFLFVGKSFASLTATSTIANVVVSGSNYSFDIYSERTSAGTNFASQVHVGITSYVFDVDQTGGLNFSAAPVLSNVNSNYSSTDGTSNDYGPMTAQWVTVGLLKKLYVQINFTGNATGNGFSLSTAGPRGEQICTVTLTVANATHTANLAWDQTNSGISTSNSASITNGYAGADNSALPVELTSFTVLAQGRTINLAWSTKTEINNSGFDVERQAVGTTPATSSTWAKVGNVTGKGTTNAPQNYSFSDVVKSAGSYNYRLKQINRDGGFTYSSEVTVKATLSPEDYKLSQNYPNPFNPSTKFNFAV